tara:strand:- start:1305 stop:2210 length:906 start_codon:yes stop_codon:yes gene_type:complete
VLWQIRSVTKQKLKEMQLSNHKEINGDHIRGGKSRLTYLWLNFLRNLRCSQKLKSKKINFGNAFETADDLGGWSPGRGLAEHFLISELPKLLDNSGYTDINNVNILDIGCGSGRSVELFETAGLGGAWTGLDIDDRFVERKSSRFNLSFNQCDVLSKDHSPEFDLIYTNSALEHIQADLDFPKKTVTWLKPKGIQLHFLPAPASLPLYLWHGWRQYSLRRIEQTFPNSAIEVYAIGGLASTILHFFFITPWENFFRISLRKKFTRVYKWLLYYSIKADDYVPIFPVFYAVVVSKRSLNNSN